jgi:hypothetical protein
MLISYAFYTSHEHVMVMSSSACMRGTCIDPNSAHPTYVHVLKIVDYWITGGVRARSFIGAMHYVISKTKYCGYWMSLLVTQILWLQDYWITELLKIADTDTWLLSYWYVLITDKTEYLK